MRLHKQLMMPGLHLLLTLKINFDAAMNCKDHKGDKAVIAWDYWGKVVDWNCRIIPGIQDPLVLEAIPCRDAIMLTINRKFTRVFIDGDSLMVIRAIHGHNSPLSIQGLIKDIFILSSNFSLICFRHVRKNRNHAANTLASKAIRDPVFLYNRLAQLLFVLCSLRP